ncbi:acyltransferase family protein [Qipengyuania zhejiangensis]|uniref:acyltransferase family protein n=1 Tax=Qipengyuania zhejiangensis TaxID=3077782 RepID=UPI002D78D7DF|nr:acyltransferase [Qipengyuania sp. Z2]
MLIDRRFSTIDAMRGIAAIAVMLFHVREDIGVDVPGGYLAVDLFFGLSGFVIAQAYQQRIRDGLGPREFMVRRAIRLWPMLALGAALGVVLHQGHAGMLFLLPNWLSPTLLFPANPPLWSLLFEMIAYLAFALALARGGVAALWALLGGSAAALAWYAGQPLAFGDFGADWRTLWAGLARVSYSFTAGVLIYRLTRDWKPGASASMVAWLPSLAMICAFLVIGPQDNGAALAAILIGVPSVVLAASCLHVPQRRLAAWLGDLSYPLYCIHVPILAVLAGAGETAMALACASVVIASSALDRHVDRPARDWLTRLHRSNADKRRRLPG